MMSRMDLWRGIAMLLFAGFVTQSAAADEPRFEGLWSGAIVFKAAELEFEITVEVGRDPQGELVGTIDQPAERMIFHPLEYVRTEGKKVTFEFLKNSESRGPNAPFTFIGEISENGQRIEGHLVEHRGNIPFYLERLGEPGSERRTVDAPQVDDLTESSEELKTAFNDDAGNVRLVLLLSPT